MRTVEGRVHVADGADPAPEDGPTYESIAAFVAALDDAGAPDVAVQAFDARYVAGPEHLASAVEHASRSMDRGENVADDRAVEILCYAAGRRQIDRALEMGVGEGTTPVVVVVDGPDEDAVAERVGSLVGPPNEGATADPQRIRSFFDVTEAELAATTASLEALVVERVALLDVDK